jgi:hypothetical protein
LIVGSAALVVLAVVGEAEKAMQWKVADGGNRHWYELVGVQLSWPEAKTLAETSILVVLSEMSAV